MSIRKEYRSYHIHPLIVRADQETWITIAGPYEHSQLRGSYDLAYYPAEFYNHTSKQHPLQFSVEAHDGKLKISLPFPNEQEHVLLLYKTNNGERIQLAEFRLYSLQEDLFTRFPYKGDLHCHTHYSDGTESPAYVACAGRRRGLDFLAITDHRQYAPSLRAIEAFSDVELEFKLFPGEEVHPPDNPVHIVNFGGSVSINALFEEQRTLYDQEVASLQQEIQARYPEADAYTIASCRWCFERIRQAGGLGIFAHHYWFTDHHYTPSGSITSALLDQLDFDALEVIGGYGGREIDSNKLQVARYYEELQQGKTIPIVGVSDAHSSENEQLFGRFLTVVFSPDTKCDNLIQSIKDNYSVAVESISGQTARVAGSFRLVKFTLYLWRELFPQHDEPCSQQGYWMHQYIEGNPKARTMLSQLNGSIQELYYRYWDIDPVIER